MPPFTGFPSAPGSPWSRTSPTYMPSIARRWRSGSSVVSAPRCCTEERRRFLPSCRARCATGSPVAALLAFLPGLAAAIVIHAGFNRLPLPPMVLTAVIMLVLPLLLLFTFERSERAMREWMGAGMDLDMEVLQLVTSEHFTVTRFGSIFASCGRRFPASSSPTCIACFASSSSSPCMRAR